MDEEYDSVLLQAYIFDRFQKSAYQEGGEVKNLLLYILGVDYCAVLGVNSLLLHQLSKYKLY